jgi:hypothetical protein
MDKNTLKNAIQQNRMKNLASSNRPQFPSVPQMAKNLGSDIVKNVRSVLAGNPLSADDTEANRRKSICNGCQFFSKGQERCMKCGCNMAIKVYLKASNCPIGKW